MRGKTENVKQDWLGQTTVEEGWKYTEEWIGTVAIDGS